MTKDKRNKIFAVAALAKVREIENTTVASLLSEINALKNRCTTLENQLTNYPTHTHNYADDNGIETITKITQGVT
ncbi:MAG: hypothetical protein KAQ94_06025 [Arcobacteraceae bacterium]|nr:hypothetical protein [Arcobacteraceae bacterium]